MHFQNQIAQSFIQILFALPDAAPANAIQVRFVDKPTERGPTGRFILVNIIERETGIETRTPADLDASAQSTRKFQSSAGDCKPSTAVVLQALMFARRVSASVGV